MQNKEDEHMKTVYKIYVNKKNENKYIEVKFDGEGHRSVRQYMSWKGTNIKNYTGDGKFHRWRKVDFEKLMEDYKEDIDMINTNKLGDYDYASGILTVHMVKMDENERIYRSASRYGFDDLMLVPYVEVEEQTAKVTPSLIKAWGKTADEVIDKGIENIEPCCADLMETIMHLQGMDTETPTPLSESVTICVTNPNKYYGAAAIIKVIDEMRKYMPDGFIVIPSSVHEVLVNRIDVCDADYADDMIRQVNSTLDEKDILSDHAYVYDGRR